MTSLLVLQMDPQEADLREEIERLRRAIDQERAERIADVARLRAALQGLQREFREAVVRQPAGQGSDVGQRDVFKQG